MMTSAAKVARYRDRQRRGRRVYKLELPEDGVEDILAAAGMLPDDPAQVPAALERFLLLTIRRVTGNGGLD